MEERGDTLSPAEARETGERLAGDRLAGAPVALPVFDLPDHGPGKREVDLYVRTYTTLLQSSGAIGVSSLEPAHLTAAASLHAGADEREPDLNAFVYSSQRLPACIVDVRAIVLAQSARGFARAGYAALDGWQGTGTDAPCHPARDAIS